MTPTLSVIIPTFNRGRTLVKVLQSLEAQSDLLRDGELIIVDDGSTDGTEALVRQRFQGTALPIRYLRHENSGAAATRNRGIREARGEIVLLLDCDIIPSRELIPAHLAFHERHPEPAAVLRGSVVAANSSGETVRRVEFHHVAHGEGQVPIPWYAFRSGNISAKRRFLADHGMFDHELRTQEDTELGYRLNRHGLRLFHSDAAVGFHDHPMEAGEYWRYARNYGRSMAMWSAKHPSLLADLAAQGIDYRYGFISWRSSPDRILKYCAKAAIANRVTIRAVESLSRSLRASSPGWSGTLSRLGYYHHFKRSFREHRRLIRRGALAVRRPVRVCMLASLLPPEYSGAARQAETLGRALNHRDDVRVSFVSYTLRRELAGDGMVQGMPVHRICTRSLGLRHKALLSLRMAVHLVRRRGTYDLLHVHGGVFLADFPTLIGKCLGKKTVFKMTAWGEDDPWTIRTRRFSWLKYPLFRLADHHIATSPQFVESHRRCGLEPDRLSLVPNAVDVERFRAADAESRRQARALIGLPDDVPVAVTVGPVIRRKRLDLLIDAWRAVTDQVPGALLLHVGPTGEDAALFGELKDRVARLSLGDRMRFVGLQEHPETYLRAADAFLFTSEREGSPNALIEAMASGLACVAYRIPGVTDDIIADSSQGVIIEPGDCDAFVNATVAVLSDPSLRERLGAGAARVASERSAEAVSDTYAALYRRLLGVPAAPTVVPEQQMEPQDVRAAALG